MATTSLFGEGASATRALLTYKDIHECFYDNMAELQSSLVHAAWGAKYVPYTFDEINIANIVLFSAYNEDCCFCIHYNKDTHECLVEFAANDDTFDYENFKNVIDYCLLCD